MSMLVAGLGDLHQFFSLLLLIAPATTIIAGSGSPVVVKDKLPKIEQAHVAS